MRGPAVGCLLVAVGVAQAGEDGGPSLATERLDYSQLHLSGSPPVWPDTQVWGELMAREGDPAPNVNLVLAANGGGYRAAAYTAGVMLALGAMPGANDQSVLESVDAFSTVSGGGFPVLRYLQDLFRDQDQDQDQQRPALGGGFVSTGASEQLDRLEGLLADLREPLDLPALLRHRPDRRVEMLSRKAGFDGELTLDDLQNAKTLPGWVPNASLAPDGALVPITAAGVRHRPEGGRDQPGPLRVGTALMASSSVPGAIPPVGVRLTRPGAPAEDAWLMDGAWADRLGLVSALELSTRQPADQRVVLVVDSRPQPQYDRDLLGSIHGERFGDGAGVKGVITRRAQLIGAGIELARYRADLWLMQEAFGAAGWAPQELSRDTAQALRFEGYERCPREESEDLGRAHLGPNREKAYCGPDLFGMRREVHASRDARQGVPVTLLRLGTDTLLQHWGWDQTIQADPDRLEACQRIGAKLFTALALQPTDLSLSNYYLLEEVSEPLFHRVMSEATLPRRMDEASKPPASWSSPPQDTPQDSNQLRPLYLYSNDRHAAEWRQSLLIAAGVLNVFLHAETLAEDLGMKTGFDREAFSDSLTPVFQQAVRVNFRTYTKARDWEVCTGIGFWVDNKWETEDHINDNCECREMIDRQEQSFLMKEGSCKAHNPLPDRVQKQTPAPDQCEESAQPPSSAPP